MNDQELALVLERDFDSLKFDNSRLYKREYRDVTIYNIDLGVEESNYNYTFRVSTRKEIVSVSWTLHIGNNRLNDEAHAYNGDGYEYLAFTKSTVNRSLKDIIIHLTTEIVFSYIKQLENDLKVIRETLEGEQ